MSRPDLFSQLPSLEELLEHPRVASVVERVSHSTAASQVRTAVAALRAEVSRRTEGWQSLGVADLVDRLVQRLETPRGAAPARRVNATGRFFDPSLPGRPWAPAAAQAFASCGDGGEAIDSARRLWNAEAAWIAPSHSRGLAAAILGLARGGALIVGRPDMAELAPGVRLDALCRQQGISLIEVGAADGVTPDDYRTAIESTSNDLARRVVLLRKSTSPSAALAIVEAAHHVGAIAVFESRRGRPRRDTPAYRSTDPSVEELLGLKADAVIVDGAGWIGGPVSGLIVGAAATVDRVADSIDARLDRLDPSVDAALAATLDLFARPAELRFSHPLHQLLDAPIDNLRQRAERLAPRLAASPGVASADPVELHSELREASWGVRVVPESGQAAELKGRSEAHGVLVEGAVSEGALVFDLATVSPSQDGSLVAVWGPETDPGPPARQD